MKKYWVILVNQSPVITVFLSIFSIIVTANVDSGIPLLSLFYLGFSILSLCVIVRHIEIEYDLRSKLRSSERQIDALIQLKKMDDAAR